MKRNEQQEQVCRRQEFVCRLYDVIKDLDKSLQTDCNKVNPFPKKEGNPFAPKPPKIRPEKPYNCACPPGCCEDSLEFKLSRIPNYPGLEDVQGRPAQGKEGGAHGHGLQEPSEYNWHKAYHSNGCWAGHDHGSGGMNCPPCPPQYGAPQSFQAPCPGGCPEIVAPRGFQVPPGGGMGFRPQAMAPQGNQPLQGFRIPSCPEEAIAMGCFVAKAA